MEGRWKKWGPWYLMTPNKWGKWNVSFATTSFHIRRIECYSIWVINMMIMEKLVLSCVQGHRHK